MMLKLLSLAFAVMFLSFSWAQDKLLMPKIDSISWIIEVVATP